MTDQLREFLAAKTLLLILDNVEHLIEAAPLVAEPRCSAGTESLDDESRASAPTGGA